MEGQLRFNMEFKITQVTHDGDEVYFTLQRYDGIEGTVQLNMNLVIRDTPLEEYIVWDDE